MLPMCISPMNHICLTKEFPDNMSSWSCSLPANHRFFFLPTLLQGRVTAETTTGLNWTNFTYVEPLTSVYSAAAWIDKVPGLRHMESQGWLRRKALKRKTPPTWSNGLLSSLARTMWVSTIVNLSSSLSILTRITRRKTNFLELSDVVLEITEQGDTRSKREKKRCLNICIPEDQHFPPRYHHRNRKF